MNKNRRKRLLYILRILLVMSIIIGQLFGGYDILSKIANASEVSDNLNNIYVSEENYSDNMKNIVEPYINNKLQYGYIDGDEDVKLYYEKYLIDNPVGNIVISHGYGESLEKYHELIYYFMKSGYNVFGIEHRGHGRSTPLGIADKTQIHVKSFEQYVKDFKSFMDEIVVPSTQGKKTFLYAHSMGGAIGAEFLENYPQYFDSAVLSAPMLEVNTGNIPSFLAKIIAKSEVALGRGGEYVIGKHSYTPEYNIKNIGTTSLNRYNYLHDIIVNNEVFQKGEASYNWANESFKVTEEITKKENAEKVKVPVLLFQAGQDTYVESGGENKFAQNADNCKIKRIENSRHEIYRERDEIQKPYLEEVLEFFNSTNEI